MKQETNPYSRAVQILKYKYGLSHSAWTNHEVIKAIADLKHLTGWQIPDGSEKKAIQRHCRDIIVPFNDEHKDFVAVKVYIPYVEGASVRAVHHVAGQNYPAPERDPTYVPTDRDMATVRGIAETKFDTGFGMGHVKKFPLDQFLTLVRLCTPTDEGVTDYDTLWKFIDYKFECQY